MLKIKLPLQPPILLLAISLAGLCDALQTCFFPSGDIAPSSSWVPCNSTTQGTQQSASACCPPGPNSYCTTDGLCYVNGLLQRGACTDASWTNSACAKTCTNNLKNGFINVFFCGPPNSWQCGTGGGPGDCSSNFSVGQQSIVLRDDQQPGQSNQVPFADPSATFVPEAAVTSASGHVVTVTAPSSSSSGTSVLGVGLAVGLSLAILLCIAIGLLIFQQRRINHLIKSEYAGPSSASSFSHWGRQRKAPTRISPEDLARAAGPTTNAAQVSPPMVERQNPPTDEAERRGRMVGEMPTSFVGHQMRGDEEVHELASPLSVYGGSPRHGSVRGLDSSIQNTPISDGYVDSVRVPQYSRSQKSQRTQDSSLNASTPSYRESPHSPLSTAGMI